LHAIGVWLSGVFSDLPAIFSRDLADDGLQVEECMTAWFGASKMGTETLMQLDQAQRPPANLSQGWSGLLWCGMVMMLHAFLVSDGQLKQEIFVLLECHIESENCTKLFLVRGKFQGKGLNLKVPL